MGWTCSFCGETTHPSGRDMMVEGVFDGAGDLLEKAHMEILRRLRKPWLWYGVGFWIHTPLGQRVEVVLGPDGLTRV